MISPSLQENPTPQSSAATDLRLIKQSLHGMMNGVASKRMREAGLSYRVNYGVELPRLQNFAATFTPSYALAVALWQEDIRECRLLAPMLMPPGDFPEDLATLWVEQMRFTEEADNVVLHLLCKQPYASSMAFRLMSAERHMERYVGYQLLNRLFMKGARLTTRDGMEFLDHAHADLLGSHSSVARAARNALLRYSDLGTPEARLAERIWKLLETEAEA